ncbi:hypothetical protein AB0F42_09015 [Streptomyces buecherae]|uniref:hypothetical protein n=1 Tax=Streptomyces buecherae TaxID=2763006 RepID=UPI0033F957ED
MSNFAFQLGRTGSKNKFIMRRQVFSWSGEVGDLGTFTIVYPTEPTDVGTSKLRAAVAHNGAELATYLGATHNGHPSLRAAEVSIGSTPISLSRNTRDVSRKSRGLSITFSGREYAYVEVVSKRKHALSRSGASVRLTRSTWKNPHTIRGQAEGAVDVADIGIALLLECVYTRNLSLRGAFFCSAGRFMDEISS